MSFIKEFVGLGQRTQSLTAGQLQTMVTQAYRTKSGNSVGPQDLISFAPLWKCLTMIPQDVAKCPLYVFKRTSNGRERAEAHQAFSYVADYPNEQQGSVEFWSQFMFHKLLYNRAMVWVDRAKNGRITGLYNLMPDRTFFDTSSMMYVSQINNRKEEFFPSEVLDVKGPRSPYLNCDFAVVARESIAVGLAAQDHSSKFLASDCQPGGILEIPAGFTKKAKDNLERGLREKMSGAQFKTLVLGDGAKWHQAQIDAEKSQLTETRLYQAREAAMWMNVPPSRLGLPDSGGYGSRTEDNMDYKDTTIIPHLNAIASECGLKMLTDGEKRSRSHYFEHNTDKLYTMDPKTHAEVWKIEREGGASNADEYRLSKNRNKIPGGDVYWQPNANHVPQQTESTNEPENDAIATARTVIKERLEDWIDKTTGKIAKESQRKTAGRFCDWWDAFRPEDFAAYFEQGRSLSVCESSQSDLFKRISEGINNRLSEVDADGLSISVTEFCENMNSKLKGELS